MIIASISDRSDPPRRCRSAIAKIAMIGVWAVAASDAGASEPIVYHLQQIPAGTDVAGDDAGRWNRLVLSAKPVLSSGAIDQLPAGFEAAVTRFSYVIMATISKSLPADPPVALGSVAASVDSPATYTLAEVGLGYSAAVDGRELIVTGSGPDVIPDLGMMDSRVLTSSEANLKTARVVVRTSTLIMFDLDVVMARQGGHRKERVRNLVWIEPISGRSAIAIWVVEPATGEGGQPESLTVSDDPIQAHRGGARVSNRFHVDGDTFVLGFPTPNSLASESLLRGKQITWNNSLREAAGRSRYSAENLAELATELNEAIRSSASRRAGKD